MKKLVTSLVVLCCFLTGFCQEKVPVFVSGTEGHKSYRIPAIVGLPNGDLLAFCEGRVHGAGDFGDINIVMKHSSDKGKPGRRCKRLWMLIRCKRAIRRRW